jgi:UDP-N-acetylglucosamine--dolichyl-phosphate N-acetylglucosaminephosphotransferase
MHHPSTLSRSETWSLLALVGAGLAILNTTFQGDGAPLVASIALCAIVFAVALSLIRWLGPVFLKAGLKGKDMAKPSRPEMYVSFLARSTWD